MSFLVNLAISLLILYWATPFNQRFYLIRPFCPHWTIPQNSLATPKVCWIIQLSLGYLDLLPCTELTESLTTLYGPASELRGLEAKTMQFHPPPLLHCSNGRLKLKFVLERTSLAASSQPYFLLSPQLQVGQQIPRSNLARLNTRVYPYSIAIYHHGFDRCLICKQPRTWWQLSRAWWQ